MSKAKGQDPSRLVKKAYRKPRIEWEEKLEPVVFAVTCARKKFQNPACMAAPQN